MDPVSFVTDQTACNRLIGTLDECLDILLDVEGVEVDPINRMEGNTPLHFAVMYAEEEPEHAIAIGMICVEFWSLAGC
jgi:hypothetical protein